MVSHEKKYKHGMYVDSEIGDFGSLIILRFLCLAL